MKLRARDIKRRELVFARVDPRAHPGRVMEAVEANVPPGPLGPGLLRSPDLVPYAQHLPQSIEQAPGPRGWQFAPTDVMHAV